ncbi:MAG: hypothetical protein KIT11_05655 [Fimbriimonadaceae bacterium]|nr:hypothetical protein [Fimbriimonadaceae bacterium]QYK56621.1 MAG: hypothetical protein KF733_03860 [Fimbriimonadaceae bacterium]
MADVASIARCVFGIFLVIYGGASLWLSVVLCGEAKEGVCFRLSVLGFLALILAEIMSGGGNG